jgi:hypothetical protein
VRTLESKVERDVVKWAKRHNQELWLLKFTVPGMRGVPDRIGLFRGGRVIFIEFKRPGAKPRKLQEWVHRKLRELGFRVYTLDSSDEAIEVLRDELYKTEA